MTQSIAADALTLYNQLVLQNAFRHIYRVAHKGEFSALPNGKYIDNGLESRVANKMRTRNVTSGYR